MATQVGETFYCDTQMRKDVQRITKESPDVLVDMGVFMQVWSQRFFGGNLYDDWTDVPVTSLARKSGMGYKRVKESVDRLEAMGIIRGMATNNEIRFRLAGASPKYTYVKRATGEEGAVVSEGRVYTKRPPNRSTPIKKEEVVVATAPEPVEKIPQPPYRVFVAANKRSWNDRDVDADGLDKRGVHIDSYLGERSIMSGTKEERELKIKAYQKWYWEEAEANGYTS